MMTMTLGHRIALLVVTSLVALMMAVVGAGLIAPAGFAAETEPSADIALTDFDAGLMADFDGDKRTELVFANEEGRLWVVKFRDGKLSASPPWQVPAGGAVGERVTGSHGGRRGRGAVRLGPQH